MGSDSDTKTGVSARLVPGEWKVADPKNDYYPKNEAGERQLFHATPTKLDHLWGNQALPNRLLQQILAVSRAEALKHGTGELTYATVTSPYSSRVIKNALTRGDVIENPNNPKYVLDRIVEGSRNPTDNVKASMESSVRTGELSGTATHLLVDSGFNDDPLLSSDDISDAMGSAYRARIKTKQRMKPSDSELGAAQDDAMAEYTRQQQSTAGDKDLFGEPLNPRSLAQSKADIPTPNGPSTTPAPNRAIDWQEEGISSTERIDRMHAHFDQLTQQLANIQEWVNARAERNR